MLLEILRRFTPQNDKGLTLLAKTKEDVIITKGDVIMTKGDVIASPLAEGRGNLGGGCFGRLLRHFVPRNDETEAPRKDMRLV